MAEYSSMAAQLEGAFNQIGSSMYSDEFACELLAWFHCFGGSNEAVVSNPALTGALEACAVKLNIGGGLIPDPDLHQIWISKVDELADCVRAGSFFPEWMVKVCQRYKLALPQEYRDFLRDDPRFWIGEKHG